MNSLNNNKTPSRPAYIKGFLWLTFSGTATLCAFLLPVHLWALSHSFTLQSNGFNRIYFFVLIVAAFYHGLYRTKTILFDIGLLKFQKIIGFAASALFMIFSGLAGYHFFWVA